MGLSIQAGTWQRAIMFCLILSTLAWANLVYRRLGSEFKNGRSLEEVVMTKTDCEGGQNPGSFVIDLLSKSAVAASFLVLGPAVMLEGPEIGNIVIVIQAMLQAKLEMLIYKFSDVTEADVPNVSKEVLSFIFSTLGIAFGMIKNKKFRCFAKGVTMGGLMATPLMGSVTKPLLEAGGLDVCAPTPEFPGGAPCAALDSISFSDPEALMCIWALTGIPLTISLITGKITSLAGNPGADHVDEAKEVIPAMLLLFSFSVTGAYMFVQGLFLLSIPIWTYVDPCGAEDALPGVQGSITIVMYSLSGVSFLFLAKKAKEEHDEEEKAEQEGTERKVGKLHQVLQTINQFIGKMAGEQIAETKKNVSDVKDQASDNLPEKVSDDKKSEEKKELAKE